MSARNAKPFSQKTNENRYFHTGLGLTFSMTYVWDSLSYDSNVNHCKYSSRNNKKDDNLYGLAG